MLFRVRKTWRIQWQNVDHFAGAGSNRSSYRWCLSRRSFLSLQHTVNQEELPFSYSQCHQHTTTCRRLQLTDRQKFRESSRKFSSERRQSDCFDITVVGGGIIGAATAMKLSQEYPTLKLALVEKESELATHQSGHNSGVVHAGIYYKPGSLKAKLCVEGLRLSYDYFAKNQILYKKCGKLIVAVSREEIPRLRDLYSRGLENNVPHLKFLEKKEEIKKYEPHCQGLMAIWSPETGIVDWAKVTKSYALNFTKGGGNIYLDFTVTNFEVNAESPDHPILISSKDGKTLRSKYVLTCGGLHSDRLAEMSGGSRDPRIIPFRGEYLLLSPEKCKLINGNIYPVPDPRFPFLGVHFTPRMDGNVWLGPNAILAFKREGYRWTDFDMRDLADAIKYKGFQRLASKYIGFGIGEMTRSACPSLQLTQLQKFIPKIGPNDIRRGPAGVRAQALDETGSLVDDFVFDSGRGPLANRILHVRNCPSPGATSSLAIAAIILEKIRTQFFSL